MTSQGLTSRGDHGGGGALTCDMLLWIWRPQTFITCSSSEALDHAGEVITVGVAVPDEEDVLVALVDLVTALGRVTIACGPHLTRGA